MKQYCRYCLELHVGSNPNYGWCCKRKRYYSKSTASKPNKCRDFVFADCEAEYQDAFMEYSRGYIPRDSANKKYDDGGEQLALKIE